METMSNYPGDPRRGWMKLRPPAGSPRTGRTQWAVMVGLVAYGAAAAIAAPAAPGKKVASNPAVASVTITERTARLNVVRSTARAPKPMTEIRPAGYPLRAFPVLQTATRRLNRVAGKESGEAAKKLASTTVSKPKPKSTGPTTGRTLKIAGNLPENTASPAPVSAEVKTSPRDGDGDLRSAPPAADSRIRNFRGAPAPRMVSTRTIKVGESHVLEFRWVTKVAVGNPAVADVVALSDNQVLVNAKGIGETNLFVWDRFGQHEYKVAVVQGIQQDLGVVARLVSRELGRNDIQVRAIGDSLFLFGKVKSQPESQQAEAVAAAYSKNVKNFIQLVQEGAVERPAAVEVAEALNQIFADGAVRARALDDGRTVVLEGNVTGEAAEQARRVAAAMARGVTVVDYFQATSARARQVLVRSRVVDIDKVKSRELGIDWGPVSTVTGPGGILQRFVGEQPFLFGEAQPGPFALDEGGPLRRFDPIGFKLRALQQQNAARILSEPNLLVLEGQKGGILIGGEIPIPVAQQSGSGNGTSITVEYKPFGIRLDVEVMGLTDEGVTLRISPEVSALDYTNSVTVNGFNLPALRTRRADSVVRIRHGQTLAIGGLLQNDINQQTKAIPLLSKIPILGELFKSRRYQKGESELVILVTPELPGPNNTVSTPIPNVELKRPDPTVKEN